VGDALITLTDVSTGFSWIVTAGRSGQYRLSPVPPGEYSALIEHLGYRPVRVLGVVIRSGTSADVTVVLTPAPLPLPRVDTVRIAAAVGAGPGEWFSPMAVRRLPDEAGELSDLGRLSARSTSDLTTEGLPGRLSGLLLNGVPYRPAHHPGLSDAQFWADRLPLSTFDRAELVVNGADVEWSGFGGATLSAFSRAGTPRLEPRVSADWTGSAVSNSKYFDTGALPNSSLRGAVLFSGPIIRDTAQFVLGVVGRRLRTVRPAAWSPGIESDSIAAVAQDSFGVGLGNYLKPHVITTDALTAFGSIAWHKSSSSQVGVAAWYTTASTGNPDLGLGAAPSLGAALDTREFFAGTTLSSTLGADASQELRWGVQSSTRTYRGTAPPATEFVDIGAPVGSDPALPGRFRRTTVRASETLHYRAGRHRVKFGVSLAFNSHDETSAFGSSGAFFFSGPGDFARRRGVFMQRSPLSPAAQFTVGQYGLFVQDLVTAGPGLDLQFGLRYDHEGLPRDKVALNKGWLQASGLDNTVFHASLSKLSPRVAFTWDLEQRHSTEVRGAAGVYFDEVDPGILGEVITESAGDTVRRGVGDLAAWPTSPDLTHAPAVGSRLTLLARNFQAPRTGRVSLSVWRALGGGLAAQVSGTYRHTDYLPRRQDLNLPIGPTASDQNGRPVYGTLVQQGGLLAAQPGTNRRFPGFDLVSAINPDGYSDYWGVTLSLERRVGSWLHLVSGYTYSRTTDNWLSGGGGEPTGQLSPFPASFGGQDWAKGRSDFDVPHRVVVAAEFEPRWPLTPRLAFVYRYRFGYPFTPGFRNGVDANGDGSAANDPAFVDASIPGIASLLSQWDCLRGQVGRFAERNACREPGVHSLDLRVTMGLVRPGGYPVEVVVDALNVLESDVGLRDHALYLVDPSKTLSINAATGVVTVPLVANPDFGKILVRETPGRAFRLGLRVNY